MVTLFVLVFSMLQSNIFGQPSEKLYYIKDGKMHIKLGKKLDDAAIEDFIKQYQLQDLAIKQFIKKNMSDSIVKKGWKIDVNNPQYCSISKSLYSDDALNNPLQQINLLSEAFSTDSVKAMNASHFGINIFKSKKGFDVVDSVVTFVLYKYYNASRVLLAGNFTNWTIKPIAMKKSADGWRATVKLAPGKYLYKFIVDGNWRLDENNKQTENDNEGNTNSVYYKTNTSFNLTGYTGARNIYVCGSFNNWQENNLRMLSTPSGWWLPIYLPHGTHTYKFIVDGNWITDPNNKDVYPNEFGQYNSVKKIGTPRLFKLHGHTNAKEVHLIGSFNGWRDYELPMIKTKDGWQTRYTLGDGNYEYKFIVDGQYVNDEGITINKNDFGSVVIDNPNYTFRLKGYENATSVFVAGDFNNWSEKGFMLKRKENEWIINLYLTKGKHLYKFIVDGNWITDPSNKLWEQNEHGTGNSVLWFNE